jgi:hypothetical protein
MCLSALHCEIGQYRFLGQTLPSLGVRARYASHPIADIMARTVNGRNVPILLQKSFAWSVNGDSVALTRFAMEAVDDGAAQ